MYDYYLLLYDIWLGVLINVKLLIKIEKRHCLFITNIKWNVTYKNAPKIHTKWQQQCHKKLRQC